MQSRLIILVVICVCLASFGTTSCTIYKPESTISTIGVAPKEIRLLIVLSQGFHSCKNAFRNLLIPVRQYIETARHDLEQHYGEAVVLKVAYMDICFTGGVLDDFKAERIFHQVIHADGTEKPRLEASPSTIHHIIETIAADMGTSRNPTHVYLIGHSHGGWLMLKTAQVWQHRADLRRLFTIDPISYQRCTQSYLIFNRLIKGLSLSTLTKDKECTRFPSDIEPHAAAIRKNISEMWTNFYQNQFLFVHSDRSTAADSNRQLSYNDLKGLDFAHKAIIDDRKVWQAISLQISGDLAEFAAKLP